jgi:predicted enzyme related to lactoylglutathione lyase
MRLGSGRSFGLRTPARDKSRRTLMNRFFQVTLRTTDVDAARTFYTAVLGGGTFDIVPLHEQAIARGARPHWLGFLDVGDVDRVAEAFGRRGATPLGPKWVNPAGLEAAVVRDPGGAVIALAKPAAGARLEPGRATGFGAGVIWHILHTSDIERAKSNYGDLFGWVFDEPVDLGSLGVFHPFAWERGGAHVGAMSDVATRPGVHPHWLFHVRVADIKSAMHSVRALGGTVVDSVTLPDGQQFAICDDPQGAAFGLI